MAIAANLIARGFEKSLPDCIKSLKQAGVDLLNITLNGVKQRDLIENTCKEIGLPYKITEFDWIDDFAACRQFNLEQLSLGFDWYLWVDSDDIVEGDLKKAVEEADKQKADVVWFWYYYSFDEFNNVTNMFIRERLIRTKCLTTMKWSGKVHETLMGAEQFKNFTYEEVVIKHKPTDENRAIRNEQWLKTALETTDDVRYKMYMAHHFSASGKPYEALKWYLDFANDPRSGLAEKWQALCYAASLYRLEGDFQKAVDTAFKAIALAPAWQDAYIELTIDYHLLGDSARALHWASEAKKKSKAPDLIFFNPLFSLRDLKIYTALSLAQIGQFDAAKELSTEAVKIYPSGAVQDIDLKIKECQIRQRTLDGIKTLCVNLLGHGEIKKLSKVKEVLPWWLADVFDEYQIIINGIDAHTRLLDPENRRQWYSEEMLLDDNSVWCQPNCPRYRWLVDKVNELGSNLRILDVGCGTGILTEQLKNSGHRVCGIEPSRKAEEYLKKRGVEYVSCFFEDFKTDEHFDVVIMTEYLEHQINPVEQFNKALRLGDRLLITVPLPIRGNAGSAYLEHLQVITVDDIEQWIATESGRRPENILTLSGVSTEMNQLAVEISHRLWSKKERFIKLFSAACSESWCPHTSVPGGSEYAIREVSQRFDAKGNLVFVYYEGDSKRAYKGVVYRPSRFFDPAGSCNIFIANRTPQVFQTPIAAEKKYLWAHDITYGESYTQSVEDSINGVFLDSEYHKQEWLKAYPWSKKLFVTGEGIQTSLFRHFKEKVSHRFIYASAPNRGLLQLLQMWPHIKKMLPDATLQVFYGWDWWDKWNGEAKLPGLKSAIIQLCQQEGIEWKGRVSNEDLAEAIKEAEIWFYPCTFPEIFCQIGVECQAANVLCFYYPIGALPETIGNRGIAITETAPDKIANIIATTLANKDKVKHLRKIARTWAMKQDWSEVASRMTEVFDR